MAEKFDISVCVCTYRRPQLLARLLRELERQSTGGLFTYGIVVVDNDSERSAAGTLEDFRGRSPVPLHHCHEPEQNIALARNRAVANAGGEFIAFIDDDEVPGADWLLNLYRTCNDYGADGVLGPVVPRYEAAAPGWVLRGKFHERPTHGTGTVLHWRQTRTGNALLRRGVLNGGEGPFRREFGRGGEDTDFFRRAAARGFRFVWCNEAPVYEAVTAERCTRSFFLRRALLRGQAPYFGAMDYAKSLAAVPVYTAALPFLLVAGQHLFMKYLIKDFDHIGRLLALFGIDVVGEDRA
ncbi:MAG: hypothetical protein Kow0025_05110 [Thermodesulfovibrionales bacterium]